MNLTAGIPDKIIGLIDGPVLMNHPDLATENMREISGSLPAACEGTDKLACMHGSFVAGILHGRRGSVLPAICPGCTLLVRPVFADTISDGDRMPGASPAALAAAMIECIDMGANVINLSIGLERPSSRDEQVINQALEYASRRQVIVVAAAGNQGMSGGSKLAQHAWVIPVAASDSAGRPAAYSSLGRSIGMRGLSAPGEGIACIDAARSRGFLGGTSAAVPFVTGTVMLLWSAFPNASATELKVAMMQAQTRRRPTIVPPLLDAWAAYQFLAKQ
ncbi:S8 family serine peptidase [Massilia sp. DJPM01]|uniref:S8 family peptidase n=1 Tax=Massilia sp. DJPM01 TaxID=3024404 RepID=UPI00259EEC75|nr:S8 family serine peptidase [Massilia sp. DJPM01]MDM5178573.1 S8 family serine peptidase [Massilia sp. DJPM01]